MHMKRELNAEIRILWDIQQDTDAKVIGPYYLTSEMKKVLPLSFYQQ